MTKPLTAGRVQHTPRQRVLRVARIDALSDSMRRMVLAGPDLEPEFPYPPLAAADHVKFVVPDEDTGQVVLPVRGADGFARPDGRPAVLRDYTIRHVDHAAHELTLDFVLHEHGPAGRWAAAATPGVEVGVLGPRGSQVFPGDHGRYLLVADETGLPATERFLEGLPADAAVHVVALGSQRPLSGRTADLRWLPADAGADDLLNVVGGLPLDTGTFAWAAGEAGMMRELRRHLRDERGLDPDRTRVRGYWRTGLAGALPRDQE